MKEILRFVLYLVVVSAVQSSVIHRKFRELELSPEKQQQQQQELTINKEESIKDLNKESIPVAIEVVKPVPVVPIQDETRPEELEKKLVADVVKEPAAIAANEIIPQQQEINKNEIKDEPKMDNIIELKPEKEENLDKTEIKQKPEKEEELDKKQSELKLTEDKVKETEKNEEILVADETKKNELPQDLSNSNDELRQNSQSETSTSRPTIFQAAQQIISSNPIGQFIDSFRRPLASTASPSLDQQQITVTVPNLLQQFQAGVQNFTNQITSVFNPNAVQQQSVSETGDTSTIRPNIIQTLQTNFQNAVSSVFRPLNMTATIQAPTNPLQVVLNPIQAVQNFLSGNRVEPVSSNRPPTSTTIIIPSPSIPNKETSNEPSASGTNPVDDKVDYNIRNSQEQLDQDQMVQAEHDAVDEENNEGTGSVENNPDREQFITLVGDSNEEQDSFEMQNQNQNLGISQNQITQNNKKPSKLQQVNQKPSDSTNYNYNKPT